MSNGRTVILGIGGGAGKVIRCMAANKGASWLEFAYIDTDAVDLENIPGVTCLSAGSDWAKGRSCGGDPLLGEKAVGASIRELKALVADTEMVIVVGCLGRGVASGGVQIVSRLVREEGLLAFFFVTMPFAHEGNGRREIAESALRDLRENSDIVVAVQNDLLFTTIAADTRANEAFAMADQVLADGVQGIAELVRCHGMMSVDFASLRALLKNREAHCSFGIGHASGANKTVEVIDDLFKSRMLGDHDFLARSDVVVASLIGGTNLSIGDMNQCLSMLDNQLGPATCSYIGANVVPEKGDELQLTIVSVHYKHKPALVPASEPAPPPTKPKRGRKGKAKVATDEKQFDLPFVEEMVSLGIFGNVPPTIVKGENLDVPTFQRQGLVLDLDD